MRISDWSSDVCSSDLHVSQHLDQVREKLHPLMVPPQMARNKLSVRYVLVIGRSAEFEHDEARRLRLANYGAERNLRIMTYDPIRREVAAVIGRASGRARVCQSV